MEGIARLVTESLARHGFDRPLDYRRLHWSRWFRCESTHSLLLVPSKPGLFAIAEEIIPAGDSASAGGRRMLAVLQFCEDDDMAFVLDRMFSHQNPMRARLASGKCFIRFVVIEDQAERRSICGALNQWLISSGEKASGIGAHFATSLELTDTHVGTAALGRPAEQSSAVGSAVVTGDALNPSLSAPQLDSGAATNLHRPSPFPSGF